MSILRHLRASIAAVLAVFSLILPRWASAGEIPTIQLSPAGPDKAIDLRQEFYLMGSILPQGGAEGFYVVFIRYRYAAWGIVPRRAAGGAYRASTCAEVSAALDTSKMDTAKLEVGGTMRVDELWPDAPTPTPASSNAVKHYENLAGPQARVLVSPGYKVTGKEDPSKWKVLVGDKKFFRPGARYCMFVVSVEKQKIEEAKVDTFVEAHLKEMEKCAALGAPDHPCFETEIARARQAVDGLGLDKESATAAKKALRKNGASALVKSVMARSAIEAELRSWTKVRRPFVIVQNKMKAGKLGDPPTPLTGKDIDLPNEKDSLGRFILNVLQNERKITGKGDQFVARKGTSAVGVDTVSLSFDTKGRSKSIEVAGRTLVGKAARATGPRETVDLQVTLAGLPTYLEGSQATMEDIVQFLSGRLPTTDGYAPIDELGTAVPPLVSAGKLGDLASGNADRAKVTQRAGDVLSAMQRAEGVPRGQAATENEQLLYALLDELLANCSDIQSPPADQCAPKSNDPNAGWWPGYLTKTAAGDPIRNPLDALVVQMEQRLEGARDWAGTRDALKAGVTGKLAKSSAALSVEADLTQRSFFDSYVTEVAGVAWLPGQDSIATAVVGLQMYFYPNLVDEPMWTNGVLDLRRVVGLQVALRASGKAYGPDDRYGILPHSRFPPLFLGGVLQLIPYTTVDLGVALFGYRRSPLTQERADLRAAFYIGVSAQFNFAGIIRRLAQGTSPAIPNGG
jgi:hypothetical protein